MNDSQKSFLARATAEAQKAQHPFPEMAASEAALESNWGNSVLAKEGQNLFGTKQHLHAIYGTMNLPTKEFENGEWIHTTSQWVKYPDWATCFADRLATLNRLASAFPHYAAALAANNPLTYITEVSKTWSTDPQRATKVWAIYQDYCAHKENA